MFRFLRQIVVSTVCLALLVCAAYPLAVTAVGKVFFPEQAAGSLVYRDGVPIGSALLGQAFSGAGFFHPRPSAASYDGHLSGGSNLGPTSSVLAERLEKEAKSLRTDQQGPLPVDRLTASASGLDPHLSPEGARMQAQRVAEARNLSIQTVLSLVDAHVEEPEWGLFGEPRVNVLQLNNALDELHHTQKP